MRRYESVVIFRPDLEEEKHKEAVEKFKKLLSDNGAEIVSVDVWGKKKLAYEIKKHKEGFYVFFVFDSEPNAVSEFERVLKISDEAIRYLVVLSDIEDEMEEQEAEEEPAEEEQAVEEEQPAEGEQTGEEEQQEEDS